MSPTSAFLGTKDLCPAVVTINEYHSSEMESISSTKPLIHWNAGT